MKGVTLQEKIEKTYDVLAKEFGYKNKMASPKIQKVVISVATGSGMKKDKNRNSFILDRLTKISGQKPSLKQAKKSVASFKIRQGDPIGVAVTLRGKRAFAFLEKLIHVALPRTKDFRGVKKSAVDEIGNLTVGVREHTIFPEVADEELKDIFGMAITVVTSAKTKKESTRFFELIGIPFQK